MANWYNLGKTFTGQAQRRGQMSMHRSLSSTRKEKGTLTFIKIVYQTLYGIGHINSGSGLTGHSPLLKYSAKQVSRGSTSLTPIPSRYSTTSSWYRDRAQTMDGAYSNREYIGSSSNIPVPNSSWKIFKNSTWPSVAAKPTKSISTSSALLGSLSRLWISINPCSWNTCKKSTASGFMLHIARVRIECALIASLRPCIWGLVLIRIWAVFMWPPHAAALMLLIPSTLIFAPRLSRRWWISSWSVHAAWVRSDGW